ncbi:hypothetical protein ACKKBG_A31905 [Auxenochlorella protothecoides x Auxenochlorella symbiontica]
MCAAAYKACFSAGCMSHAHGWTWTGLNATRRGLADLSACRAGKSSPETRQKLELTIRDLQGPEELQAVALLRAHAFYTYPPERAFAGQLHQLMKVEEEVRELGHAIASFPLDQAGLDLRMTSLVALADASRHADLDPGYHIPSKDGVVLSTLDLYIASALPGEYLIGRTRNAAYLANLATAEGVKRRGIGRSLVSAARQLAREHGVDALYVHTLAVNTVARDFYASCGFVVEREESSNTAHYRGKCLDGVEGKGRTVLLRDTQL